MINDSISNRLARDIDLQTEMQPLNSLLEIYGDHRVLVENHRGVREYSHEKVVVCVKSGNVCICGKDLHIVLMSRIRIVIQGKICNIMLNEEG